MSEANPTPPALREALKHLFPTAAHNLDQMAEYELDYILHHAFAEAWEIEAHPRLADVAAVAGALGLRVDDLDTPTLIRRFVGDPMCLTISDKGWSGMGKFPPQGWNPDETKALLLALLTARATKVCAA